MIYAYVFTLCLQICILLHATFGYYIFNNVWPAWFQVWFQLDLNAFQISHFCVLTINPRTTPAGFMFWLSVLLGSSLTTLGNTYLLKFFFRVWAQFSYPLLILQALAQNRSRICCRRKKVPKIFGRHINHIQYFIDQHYSQMLKVDS